METDLGGNGKPSNGKRGDKAGFGFECNGHPGKVTVSLVPSAELEGEGFPVCTATIEFSVDGSEAFLGWVQLVRSTDNGSEGREFELDPFFLFRDVPSPYCFFGFKPALFDAPSRQTKKPVKWLAHSFLAFTSPEPELFTDLKSRRVTFLMGFSWGFDIDSQKTIALRSIERLAPAQWNGRLAVLRENCPTWRFDEATGVP